MRRPTTRMKEAEMYMTLTTDGEWTEHEGIPAYEQLSAGVGGLIEAVSMMHDGEEATLWVNEEGKLTGLPRNGMAGYVAHEKKAIFVNDWIAGNVVFTGGADREGETMELGPKWTEYLRTVAKSVFEIRFPG
jgi:hypothetical protein